MAVSAQQISKAGILSQGQYPVFALQGVSAISAPALPPVLYTDAVALATPGGKAIEALVRVNLREFAAYRQASLAFVKDDSVLYRVVINGTNCNYTSDASATTSEIATGVAAAINAAVGSVVTATVNDAGTGVDIISDVLADYTLTNTGTVGTITITAEAVTVTFDIWLGFGLGGDVEWNRINNCVNLSATQNWVERIPCAGADYMYVQVKTTDGTVWIKIGPCGLEL